MKKKELELLLQKVPQPDNPLIHLEQYMTPAVIAADVIFISHQFGDIQDKTILDLGCGTGIFAVGALVTGAKKVIAVDTDREIIQFGPCSEIQCK